MLDVGERGRVRRGARRARCAGRRVDDHFAVRSCLHVARGERADAARRRARGARRARRRQRPLRDQLVPAHRVGAGQAEQPRRRRSRAEGSGQGVVRRGVPRERGAEGRMARRPPLPVDDPGDLAAAHEGHHTSRVDREVVQGVHDAAARALLRDGVRRAPRRHRRLRARAALVHRREWLADPGAGRGAVRRG